MNIIPKEHARAFDKLTNSAYDNYALRVPWTPQAALAYLKEMVVEATCLDDDAFAAITSLTAVLDERDALRALLSEWLHEGRFLVANTPEQDDLVRRTRAALPEGRQPMKEGGAGDAESA